ncbi:hypothetical protein Rhopal_001528-T1 [Rhodotorula paludigena]|uniref:Uncharacterized protein n=1 Tax=Rhodotorula paludigena TaxID=86838 RepID=A0AAV5GGP2_9BASI|nr:hypothetical protein Rhopal_001528-T1 [Rhodotorula paludigena]
MLASVDREALSSALGVASIVTWLGAQSPQILVNYRNKSVEGDFTNLLGQYAYYSRLRPPRPIPPLNEDYPYAHPPPIVSHLHGRHRSRTRKGRSRSSKTRLRQPGADSEEDPMAASWMTDSSAHTTPATTSPRIPVRPLHSRSSTAQSVSIPPSTAPSTVPPSPTAPERGRTLQRSAVRTFDPTLSTIHGSPSTHGFTHPSMHASHVSFNAEPDEIPAASEANEVLRHAQRQRTSSSRSRPPVSRRSTSVVFLSVGALFTFGQLRPGGGLGTMSAASGRAWSSAPAPAPIAAALPDLRHPAFFLPPDTPAPSSSVLDSALPSRLHERSTFPLDVSTGPSSTYVAFDAADEPDDMPFPPSGIDWERLIGRISAWICTTAYLTSRLPQIWQNFRRRSCEGLAMTLFAAAFLGNSLYVASVLASPRATTSGYLVESTPYLLGSGGTLCFDLTILAQAWLYSGRRRARKDRERRRKAAHGFDAEEEAALLHADGADDDDGETYIGPIRRSKRERERERDGRRSRSTSTTPGYGRSVSTGGSSRRALSQRSESTELLPPSSLSRDSSVRGARFVAPRTADRGNLVDEPFDFYLGDDHGLDEAARLPNRSTSRGPSSRAHSRRSSVDMTIAEEGESNVTLR